MRELMWGLQDDRVAEAMSEGSHERALNPLCFFCCHCRITISEDGNLRIVNVTKSDAGSYTCVATNHFGTASSTGNLVVKGNE